VLQEVDLRLKPDRVCNPDLVIAGDFVDGQAIDAGAVRLVCEITSPSNAANDRLVKMNYYATAGIPWYLLIEQESAELHLYRLAEDTYHLHSLIAPVTSSTSSSPSSPPSTRKSWSGVTEVLSYRPHRVGA
jgi:Uma2 family endonuclease